MEEKKSIIVSVLAKDILTVLKDLNQPDDSIVFTLELKLEDTKETYEYLINSGKIVDWKPCPPVQK